MSKSLGNETSLSRAVRPPCRCGLFSLVAPLVGLLIGYASLWVRWMRPDDWGFGHLVVGIAIFAFFAVIGLFCAIVSLMRREKWVLVPLLGLLINAITLYLVAIEMAS